MDNKEYDKFIERLGEIGFLYITTYGLSKRIVLDAIYEVLNDKYKEWRENKIQNA